MSREALTGMPCFNRISRVNFRAINLDGIMENTLHHSLSLLSRFLTKGPIRRKIDRTLARILIETLRCGSVPQHIAFVMDGNRRFAKQRGKETAVGHHMGFDNLKQASCDCIHAPTDTS